MFCVCGVTCGCVEAIVHSSGLWVGDVRFLWRAGVTGYAQNMMFLVCFATAGLACRETGETFGHCLAIILGRLGNIWVSFCSSLAVLGVAGVLFSNGVVFQTFPPRKGTTFWVPL